MLGGTGYWWVLRVLLPAALTAALVLEYAFLADEPCTVSEPCLPMPGWNLMDGLHVGAMAAMWLVPGAGLPLTGLTTLPYIVDYAALGELATPSGLAALAQLALSAAGSWLVLRLRRMPLPRTRAARLPARGRDVLASRGVGTVELGVVVALTASLGLLGWYGWLQSGTAGHLARAEATEVEVVAVDQDDWLLDVRVPGTSGTTEVGVYDVEGFDVGDSVPAMVDSTARPAWVNLVSEPVEHDGWLVLAGAVGVLASALGSVRALALRGRRRLLVEGGPAWSTTVAPGKDGSTVLLPGLGLKAQLVRRMPADEVLEGFGLLRHEVTADLLGAEPLEVPEEWSEEERSRQEEFAPAWRGERLTGRASGADDFDDHDAAVGPDAIGPVVLVGDPRPGGMVVAVTPDAVLAPYGSLVPMSPLDHWRLRSATDHNVTVDEQEEDGGDGYDAAGLPGSVVAPLPVGVEPRMSDGRRVSEVRLELPRWRVLASAALLLLPAAFWLTADGSLPPEEQLSWSQTIGVLFGAGSLAFGGLAFARSSARLRADGGPRRGPRVRGGSPVVDYRGSPGHRGRRRGRSRCGRRRRPGRRGRATRRVGPPDRCRSCGTLAAECGQADRPDGWLDAQADCRPARRWWCRAVRLGRRRLDGVALRVRRSVNACDDCCAGASGQRVRDVRR